MAVYVKCPQCKKEVPFGRLFCTFCGAKLELTPETVMNNVSAGEVLAVLRRWIKRLASLAVVAVVIGVFIWPMPPQGKVGGPAQERACEQRFQTSKARVMNGIVFSESFPEEEVNAWIKDRVSKLGDASSGAGFTLTDVNLAFSPHKIVVNSRMSLSKITISYEIELEPSLTSRGFSTKIQAVRVGHVPMPEFAHDFLAERALHVFSELRNELDVLNKMKQLDVTDHQVRVSNQNR